MTTPDEIIAAWTAAYERASGKPPVGGGMRYKNGWYRTSFAAFRKAEVIDIINRLEPKS